MSIKAISTNIGKALLINALFMFIAIIISVIDGLDPAFTPLVISFLVTTITGTFPFIFVKNSQPATLQSGFLTIVLSWLLSIIFGMLPYILWGGEFTIANAWFESVSGYTTTGSTILTDIEALPRSLLFWRSSTHFIGGLGVIVFLLIIIPDSSGAKLRLTHLELSSLSKEGYRYKSRTISRVMVSVYIGLAILETLLLWAAGMTPFDAVNHAFSTVSTGGFSTKNASIMYFDSVAIEIIITVFMAMSAMNFGVIFAVIAKRSMKPLQHPVTRYYFGMMAALSIIIALTLKIEGGYGSWGKALLDSTFQTVSYISTTGFGQTENALWPVLANTILLFGALHGGCAGSTTGGIKADRMYIALSAIKGEFRKRLHPSSLVRTKVGNRIISDGTVSSVFLYIVLYLLIIAASFALAVICGIDVSEAFSGTLATLGNVGPATGTLGTMGNYSALPSAAKFVFTINMFIGRLEIFPVLIVISMIFKREK